MAVIVSLTGRTVPMVVTEFQVEGLLVRMSVHIGSVRFRRGCITPSRQG
ncbi:MAG: hypothetical protein R2854_08650 [Caldilineaceae bacterium]